MTEQHQKFLERLRRSTNAIFTVAHYLSRKGFDVKIPAIKYAPTVDVHEDYADDGDIMISNDGVNWDRVEVKGVSVQFTCKEDYPFKRVLLGNKIATDRANPFPRAYFIVSSDLKHAAIIKGETRDQWFETEILPKTTGVPEISYAVNMDVPVFIKL